MLSSTTAIGYLLDYEKVRSRTNERNAHKLNATPNLSKPMFLVGAVQGAVHKSLIFVPLPATSLRSSGMVNQRADSIAGGRDAQDGRF